MAKKLKGVDNIFFPSLGQLDPSTQLQTILPAVRKHELEIIALDKFLKATDKQMAGTKEDLDKVLIVLDKIVKALETKKTKVSQLSLGKKK